MVCFGSVPVDEDGLAINELGKLLSCNSSKEKCSTSKRVFSAGLFLTPHFQNPTGTCLSVGMLLRSIIMMN